MLGFFLIRRTNLVWTGLKISCTLPESGQPVMYTCAHIPAMYNCQLCTSNVLRFLGTLLYTVICVYNKQDAHFLICWNNKMGYDGHFMTLFWCCYMSLNELLYKMGALFDSALYSAYPLTYNNMEQVRYCFRDGCGNVP